MINTLIIHTPPTVLSRRHLSEIGVSESRHGGRYPLHHVSSPSESSLSITYKSKFIHAPPRLSHASCITHTHTHTHTHTQHAIIEHPIRSELGSRKAPLAVEKHHTSALHCPELSRRILAPHSLFVILINPSPSSTPPLLSSFPPTSTLEGEVVRRIP